MEKIDQKMTSGGWLTLAQASARVAREQSREVDVDTIISLAMEGHLPVGARIPGWEGPGKGGLRWFYPDGTEAFVGFEFMAPADGIARWMDRDKLEILAVHGRVTLAGLRWQPKVVVSDVGAIALTAGPDSPVVVRDDLRILEADLPRIVSALNGEPPPAPEEPAVAPCVDRTKFQACLGAGEKLIRRWQELAGQIAAQRNRETDPCMPPSEIEAAIRLREYLEDQMHAVEAVPEFHVALVDYIDRLETERAHMTDVEGAMQLDAGIESWRAHRLRIHRATAAEKHPRTPNDRFNPADDAPWNVRIQIEATDRARQMLKMGGDPTKSNLALGLVKWCVDNDVIPPSGIFPSKQTIRKIALKGWIVPKE